VAGIVLARSGFSVLLIEQHRFPRDKVCGECLSDLGIGVLERLSLKTPLFDFGPAILRETMIHGTDGSSARFDLPAEMWGISRKRLDLYLLEAARTSGAAVLQPGKVLEIEPGARVVVSVRDMVSDRVEKIECLFVVVADGKGAFLPNRARVTEDLGVKTHFENVDGPEDAIELFGVHGHYAGLAAIEGGVWNSAFSVPATRIGKLKGDFDALLALMMKENPIFRRRLLGAKRRGEWLASPLPRFAVNEQWPVNVVPIGNAVAALEPIGGEGMGLAMRAAELAAHSIGVALRGGVLDVRGLQAEFKRLWRLRRTSCRAIAMAMSRPAIAELAIGAASANEGISTLVMRCMGKGNATV
jgi:flavin-dependent dehydrogenase